MRDRPVEAPEAAVLLPPASKDAPSGSRDPLDDAGRFVIGLLHQAAEVAKENCQHAVGVAQKLALQLRAAEDRIKRLEADVKHHQERSDRAERWFQRISQEIEQKLLERNPGESRNNSQRPSLSNGRAAP